jgi:uncharacterized protein (DUF1697 family)
MKRYVALLRGVSPMNCRMAALKACFEGAGFSDVKTLLSSGNVVFSTRIAVSPDKLRQRAEAAMEDDLGRSFGTFIRTTAELQALLDADAYAGFELAANAKRIVTFLREPGDAKAAKLKLPIELDGARILKVSGAEVLSAYVPSANGPVFMSLLERTFGKDITTRTLETVRKCARA